MPFGLKNALRVFQCAACLAGIIGNETFVYLNNIIIFSETFEEHIKRLKNGLVVSDNSISDST